MNKNYTYLYIMENKIYEPTSPDFPPPEKFEPTTPDFPPPEKFEPTSPDSPPPQDLEKSPEVLGPTKEESVKEEKPRNPKKDFETMVEFYLADNPHAHHGKVGELEIRFGTNPKSGKPLSKIDYDNVVQFFYSAGFTSENTEGLSILRIQSEELFKKTGQIRISNIRAEIMGIDLIQQYCRTNNLQKLLDLPSTTNAIADKIKFTQKHPPYIGDSRETSKPLKMVDFTDFNFRVSYQYEKDFYSHTEVAKRILSNWLDSKKVFRYINRVRLRHPDLPVFLDISILKESPKMNKHVKIPKYTVQEANLFNNEESYEVELELDNSRVGIGTEYTTSEAILDVLRKCIRMVLSGLQGTNYPISNSEKDKVLRSYFELLFEEEYVNDYMNKYNSSQFNISNNARKKLVKHFIGPSSYTLQMSNIVPLPEESKERISSIPNIRDNYTVTDKADGERKMLYIAPNGYIYMIDTNMNIIFTGMVTNNKEHFGSLLDGEHIKYDKNRKFVNLYAAFDIYYINNKSVRELNFVATEENDEANKFRLYLLNNFIKELKPKSVLDKDSGNSSTVKPHGKVDDEQSHACWLTIKCKTFQYSYKGNIFSGCENILSKVRDGSYEYNTDGLIFTPTSTGVGGSRSGKAGPLSKFTWEQSFKWKPAIFNTIDFLVSVKKDKNGKDEIHHIFQDGESLTNKDSIIQYKTLILKCGFSRKDHGYLNPMLDVLNDQLPEQSEKDNYQKYEPVPFQPTNPYDPEAYYCNVELKEGGNGLVMLTEENEYFGEDMIVEFSYDKSKRGYWRWNPLRVRYDKTNDLRVNKNNFGNAYHVANSNWHSIHNPITEEMITTGLNIPETFGEDDDVYYNNNDKTTNTEALRNFHNLYVKKKLIIGTCNRGETLIDYAVGKGGDFPKWISSNLEFVFGIDVSKDNIENKKNGAYARYLNYRQNYNQMPNALFVHGNSGQNIRNGKALFSEKDRQITNAVFGNGAKDQESLGDGVYKNFGIGKDGFHISSCQFALHYFFGGGSNQGENERIMHSFLRNVSECTKVNGYFIGTCYDGETVFEILKSKNKGEAMTLYSDDEKIFEITKEYSHTGFPEDEYSLGYAVNVYQESINKEFREYLVHFKYLQRMLENYGFSLITSEEAQDIGLPNGSGLFDELYNTMVSEIEQNMKNKNEYRNAEKMTIEEKRISFMNRYFVFRKTHNVNAEKVYKLFVDKHFKQKEDNEDDGDKILTPVQEEKKEDKKETQVEEKPKQTIIIRKLPGKKIKLTIGKNETTKGEEVSETPVVVIKKKK